MLLECNGTFLHIIEYLVCFVEENSVLMGIVTSMIVSSLWFRKYIKQKRAEAFFGFYAKLSLCLKSLQTKLEENDQLNVTNNEAGNIYTLIYTEDVIETVCPSYSPPDKNELEQYKSAAKELKETLLNTENNVYPQGAKREEWYKSQYIIYSFCEFIENKACQHITNEEREKDEYKHIIKCKQLIDAINNIQESIDNAKY